MSRPGSESGTSSDPARTFPGESRGPAKRASLDPGFLRGTSDRLAEQRHRFLVQFPRRRGDDSAAGEIVASPPVADHAAGAADDRSEEHTSELQSLMRSSFAVLCLN